MATDEVLYDIDALEAAYQDVIRIGSDDLPLEDGLQWSEAPEEGTQSD